jgi:aldose 1-epimerase
MTTTLELTNGALRLALRADLGGAIAGLWHGGLPVLRSSEPAALSSTRAAACYPLVPYSNRLGYRRFRFQGHDYTTAPNFGDSPHSVHGVAWQRPWELLRSGATSAELRYVHVPDAHWPFAFECMQRFVLGEDTLEVHAVLANSGAVAQPGGLGWHPYFPRRSAAGCTWNCPTAGRATPPACRHAVCRSPASTATSRTWLSTTVSKAGAARRGCATSGCRCD